MTAWWVEHDPAVWLRVPPFWGEQNWPDHRAWARDVAEACWGDFGLDPGEGEVDNLALALAAYAEKLQSGELPAQDFYLHLPDPRMVPLAVNLGVWDAEGEQETALRALSNADDPEAIEPPIVETFSTEHLGEGLRTLRYCPFEPRPDRPREPGALYASLNYAWRVEEYESDVRLFSSSPDIGRLIQVINEIDELACGIHLVRESGARSGESPDP